MSPYGDRFGGAGEILSERAFDRIELWLRPSLTLITPTGVLPSASSRNCWTRPAAQARRLLRLDVA